MIVSDYASDHVAHFCMEPMNATVRVDADAVEVWVSTQSPTAAQDAIAQLSGLAVDKITVNSTLLGGGFGRRAEADYAADAYLLAKEMPGRPVKLIYSREDDVLGDRYRPLVAQHVEVGLDAAGKIVGWRHRVVGESYFARLFPALAAKTGGKDGLVAGVQLPYPIDNQLVEYLRQDRGVAIGALRGIAAGYTKFAVEGMIDEIASVNNVDPLTLRLDLLRGDAARGQCAENRGRAGGLDPQAAGARPRYRLFGRFIELSGGHRRDFRGPGNQRNPRP